MYKLIDIYKDLSIKNVDFNLKNETSISNHLKLITILWNFRDKNNSLIYDATTKYLISHQNSSLKIKSVFVIDENTKIKNLLSKSNKETF